MSESTCNIGVINLVLAVLGTNVRPHAIREKRSECQQNEHDCVENKNKQRLCVSCKHEFGGGGTYVESDSALHCRKKPTLFW